jgi:glucose/arabinose dehydrogenase
MTFQHAALAASCVAVLSVAGEPRLVAQDFPPGFSAELVASGLSRPTAMAFAPDGRIFVAEQGGKLRVIKDGGLLPDPFVTVKTTDVGERGLLGVAFDPDFDTNQLVYVYYTATKPAVHNRISRFVANGDQAVRGSQQIVLELNNLSGATNHNGGAIHFGIDGKLYVGVGENANGANSQSLGNLLGKILRINGNGSIPPDNPFFTAATGKNRAIWALGLRNPFTFGIQRSTGRIHINDVGANTWEEINRGVAGANYGWPVYEGPETDPQYRPPIFAYMHDEGCAITGGAFYDPPVVVYTTDYVGDYFFADLCGGWIRRYDRVTDTATDFATGISVPVDLQVGDDGLLYYLERGSGSVWKVEFTP